MARYVNIDDFYELVDGGFDIEFDEITKPHVLRMIDEFAESEKLQMYREVRIDEDGNEKIVGYRFGEPWVAMALYTEGGFKTQKEALIRWYNELQDQGQTNR